jgi:hypothetical protein
MLENRDLTWRDQQWDHWRPVEVHSDKDMQIPLRFHAVSLNDRPNRFVVPEWPVLSGPQRPACCLRVKNEGRTNTLVPATQGAATTSGHPAVANAITLPNGFTPLSHVRKTR